MFRTKKKKAGVATRKRKDLDDEEENVAVQSHLPTTESMDVDDGEISAPNDIGRATNDLLQHENGGVRQDEDEETMLAQMRDRLQKNKNKSGGSMAFSSKSGVSKKKTGRATINLDEEQDDGMGGASSAQPVGGGLSFEQETNQVDKKSAKKMRIRPNLSVAPSNEVAQEDEDPTANLYSQDMLASLLREQNVLLRRPVPHSELALDPMEVVDHQSLDGLEMTGEKASAVLDEEMKSESADEEFIPLNAKMMQQKKSKKRVTFGVTNEEIYPPKSAEVEEPVPTSDVEEEEDDDQSRRWEEELMRRGGGHHIPQTRPARYDPKQAYPTRKKVQCASLGEVMRSIHRKMEAGSIERDRVARELARLDAETELIQKKLKEQRNELVISSEEYEYFQVIEDYVKGLSFCLREKLPLIEAEEEKRASLWSKLTKATREQRSNDIQDEIRHDLLVHAVKERQFVNVPSSMRVLSAREVADVEGLRSDRLRRRYESSSTPDPADWNVFEDAVDDINSLERVYDRFQEWKNKFPDVYKNAYTDIALVKLYAPYIRAELIDWDPLAVASTARSSQTQRCRISDMKWLKALRLHNLQQVDELEEPVSSLLREVVVARLADATKTHFDAFSSTHTQSVIDLIEDLVRLNAVKYVEHGLDEAVSNVFTALTSEAKQLPLLAVGPEEAPVDRVRQFAAFLVDEFSVLLENSLTLFVALPHGPLHQRGFNAVMQILHQLLAYVSHCKHLGKTVMLAQIRRTVRQLSSSSFMQSLLARSAREQFEFQHILQLLASSIADHAHQT